MKKENATLKAVGFFVVLVAALAFLALPSSQAAKGKPVRWKATFVNDDGTANLRGVSGEDYVGGVNGVDITNGTGTCATTGTTYSFLQMRVYDPSYLHFDMGDLSSGNSDSASCGFPNTTSGLTWPYCVANFLNSYSHPTPDYQWVLVRFTTCSACDNPPIAIPNLINMGVGDILPVHMSIEIWSHPFDCPANSQWAKNPLHNLIMNAHGYSKVVGELPDIYIKRISPTEWIASVDTKFDNLAYQNLPTSATWANSDNILGQYATCAGKGKNTSMTYHYPWAKAPLKFQIQFTKY